MSETKSFPAGWYQHPTTKATTWWDGAQWTEGQGAAVVEPLAPGVLWQSKGKPLTGLGGGRFKLTAELLYVETGTLSTKAKQIGVHEIHDVDASQTMTQKARQVGDIILMANRPGGAERVALVDVPDFRDGVRLINEAAHAARDAHRTKQTTSTVNYTGGFPGAAPPVAAPATPTATAGSSLNDELARLASFKEQGILDDAEFAAAKKKLLGL